MLSPTAEDRSNKKADNGIKRPNST